jgi:hypothetical protein
MAQSSGELDIDIKVTGLSDLRSQLKAAKDEVIALQSADVIDPAKISEATKRAGALKDALNDANEQIAVMSGGSDFEKVSNGLGLIGSQLKDLDFEGANASAKNLTKVMQTMNPATVAKGFTDLAGTVLQLGKAFLTMGLQLLANPIFLIVAVIVAVVAAIVLLKDKVKIMETAFNMLMGPIKVLIQGLKDLTDWLGLTAFAEEEAAQKSLDATNKRITANEKLTSSMDKEYGRQIALAKANGEDTTKLETEAAKFKQQKSYENTNNLNKEIKTQSDLLKNQTQEQQKETRKTIAELSKSRDEQVQINKDAANEVNVIKATARVKDVDDAKKAGEKATADTQRRNKEIEDATKRHLAVVRGLRDLEIQNMEEGLQKDLSINQEKYKRELEDLKTNKDISKAERIKYEEQYRIEKEIADKKSYATEKKKLEDEAKIKKEARDKEIAEMEANSAKIRQLNQNYTDYILEHTGTDLEKKEAIIEKARNAALDNENELFKLEIANLKLTQDEKEKLEKEHRARLKKINEIADGEQANATEVNDTEQLGKKMEYYAQLGAKVVEGLSALNGLLNQSDNNRLNDVKTTQDAEISSLEQKQQKELSASNLSESQKKIINDKYAKLKYQADLKAFNETEKIKKKQFIRDKAMSLASTAMNIASGIMQIWGNSPDPTGISQTTLTAIIAGIGAIQLATIAAQKYQGESGPAAPSIGAGGGGGGGGATEPALALFGRNSEANTTQQGQSVEANQSITVNAIVSETEITATQGKVAKMQKSAEL